MAKYDFIIVGLGTAGAATCMTLARRGYTVLGVDQYRPPHNLGSHHGLSRSVRRAYLEGTSYVSMALKSWELWRKLEKDTGKKLLAKTGNLTIGPPDCPAITGFLASAETYGIPHEYLTASEVRKRWPELNPPDSFVAGLEKEAGIAFPEASIATFLTEAQKAGATLVMDERVDRWSEENGKITIRTAGKRYEADRLLVSTGGWVNKSLDLPDSPLTTKRVPVHWVEAPKNGKYHLGNFPVNFWQIPMEMKQSTSQKYREFYTLPIIEKGTRIKAAFHNGLADCDPDTVGRDVLPGEKNLLRETLSEFLPGLYQSSISSEVCLYSMTPDGHFYLGRRPGSQRVIGVALAGHGFKFAPVLGEILADLMVGIAPSFDIEMFSPNRFDCL